MEKAAMPRRGLPTAAIIPCLLLTLLSGCAGVGNYLHSSIDPFGDPNAPPSETLNMQRARGQQVAVQPVLSQPGDIWPGKVKPIPTLAQIQQNMNSPLGQAYQNEYGPMPGHTGAAFAVRPTGSAPAAPTGVAVGKTLIGPAGPVGIVSTPSNGRYQQVSPLNGQGGGILIPSGTGTATLVEPNGQSITVQVPAQ
ncbi:MAG: hypothetical protein B7Z67_12720 [Acidiphilium sp. 21-60-14]|nr:MAG: hypothetical protein B7Z67_12720 [Acidiphilium sp. 21-60-14]OYV89525.1 MAG: hypothetical protein B7Z57_12370 [Acidiphilium sp. 37-60-79]OZB39668.1 MAG: hypothetical protein B7X48_08110 [Acidiphilium sp. 34-60-192]